MPVPSHSLHCSWSFPGVSLAPCDAELSIGREGLDAAIGGEASGQVLRGSFMLSMYESTASASS